MPGMFDGRSVLEVDLNAMAEKPWRRPGADISDWFNYGFDEISWEAYCYRRRDLGEMGNVLKLNVIVCPQFFVSNDTAIHRCFLHTELCRHARGAAIRTSTRAQDHGHDRRELADVGRRAKSWYDGWWRRHEPDDGHVWDGWNEHGDGHGHEWRHADADAGWGAYDAGGSGSG